MFQKTETRVRMSDGEGRGKFSVRGKYPSTCKRGESGTAAKFSGSSRGCLQGVEMGDNRNRDGPTDRERQPRGASLAYQLSSQTANNNTAVPAALSKVKIAQRKTNAQDLCQCWKK